MNDGTVSDTQYMPFTTAWIKGTLLECLRRDSSVEELEFVKEDKEELCVADICGDGYLNYVLRVWPATDLNRSIVLKQYPPFWRTNHKVPLTQKRSELEFKALTKFYSILTGCVPRPLAYDGEKHVVCMEDLREHTLYRKWLLAGNVDEDVARKLARSLADIHSRTHVTNIGEDALQQLELEFRNKQLRKEMEEFGFEYPYRKEKVTKIISQTLKEHLDSVLEDEDLLEAKSQVRRVFLEKKECLIHGDCHTNAVMVKGSDVRMFDLELAHVGPCARDLGQLLGHYVFNYFHHLHHPDNNNQTHTRMVDALPRIIRAKVDEYLKHLEVKVEDRDQYNRQLMSEMAGFTASELIVRSLSIAPVEDMLTVQSAQPHALAAGCRLMKAHRRVHDVTAMIDTLIDQNS